MKRLLPYYRLLLPHRWAFLGSVFCALLYGAASGAGLPYVLRYVFPLLFDGESASEEAKNSVLTSFLGANPDPDKVLLFTIVLLPVTLVVRSVCGFLNTYLIAYCGVKVLESIRHNLFSKIQNLHLGYFRHHKSGDLLSRLMVDCNMLKNAIVNASNSLLREPFTFLFATATLVFLCYLNSQNLFILLCLAAVPLCVVPVRMIGKRLEARAMRLQKQTGTLTEVASENLNAAREIRAFNLENSEKHKFDETVRRFLGYQMKVVKYDKALGPLIELTTGLVITAAIYYAAKARLDLKAGEVAALFLALHTCYEPIKKLGNVNNLIRKGLASLDRIEEVLHAPVEADDPPTPVPLPNPLQGEIVFSGVDFDYGDGPVLHDIRCTLKSGTTYALIGPSGAGKSTFIQLVLRFYDPVSGTITLDGLDLRNVTRHDLRSHIALVPQDPVLFNASLFDNIKLSRPEASREKVFDAARRAYAHEFIEAFEQGYDTIAGDRGTRLSGGQKQRIAIARAFLKNSPVLILDEATSALDSDSESRIQEALQELFKGKTVLMIAHRFSTLRMADSIIVFEEGRITGQGTHNQLFKDNTVYQNLYRKQELG